MSTDKKPNPDQSSKEQEIKIDDLPLESGRDVDADDVRGGTLVLQDVLVSGRRPRGT